MPTIAADTCIFLIILAIIILLVASIVIFKELNNIVNKLNLPSSNNATIENIKYNVDRLRDELRAHRNEIKITKESVIIDEAMYKVLNTVLYKYHRDDIIYVMNTLESSNIVPTPELLKMLDEVNYNILHKALIKKFKGE